MTLGERILNKRKEKGMSQEELGSKLEVSRQTVYKWETDQAIPELNKLIALAGIFDVKVGWLIAEETDEKKEDTYAEVTEKIVDLMKKREKKPALSSFSRVAAWILASLFVFACIFAFTKFRALEGKYQDLDWAINRNNNYVQQQINGISSNISNILNNYNSITVDSQAAVSGIDFERNRVSITVSALPKTYTSGMRAVFHVALGDEIYDFEGVEKSNKTFEAAAEIPLTNDEATVSVEFIHGETSVTNNIRTFYELLSGTFPLYDCISWPFEKWIKGDYSGFTYDYFEIIEQNLKDRSGYYGSGYKPPRIVAREAFLTEDGVRIADYVYDEEYTNRVKPQSDESDDRGPNWYCFKRPDSIRLTEGKTYREHFIATDEYGRQIEVITSDYGQELVFHVKE